MWSDFGFILKPLNPTGRWKIKTCAYYKNKLFVEHKGLFFKRWVSEDNIIFAPAEVEEIFTCSS